MTSCMNYFYCCIGHCNITVHTVSHYSLYFRLWVDNNLRVLYGKLLKISNSFIHNNRDLQSAFDSWQRFNNTIISYVKVNFICTYSSTKIAHKPVLLSTAYRLTFGIFPLTSISSFLPLTHHSESLVFKTKI